jgi:hypothetical protein
MEKQLEVSNNDVKKLIDQTNEKNKQATYEMRKIFNNKIENL